MINYVDFILNLNIFAGQLFKSPFYCDKSKPNKKKKPSTNADFIFFLSSNWAK
jgi:hypothetical protein